MATREKRRKCKYMLAQRPFRPPKSSAARDAKVQKLIFINLDSVASTGGRGNSELITRAIPGFFDMFMAIFLQGLWQALTNPLDMGSAGAGAF
jgi:hypothetical protein